LKKIITPNFCKYKLSKNKPLTRLESETYSKYCDLENEIKKVSAGADMGIMCDYCGENVFRQRPQEDELTLIGKALYEWFIDFMGLDRSKMPKDIFFKIVDDWSPAGRYRYDRILQRHVIEINKRETGRAFDMLDTLFHEFTHLMQAIDPDTGEHSGKPPESFYEGEYFAVQIQIKRMLGYGNVNENKAFDLNTNVIHNNHIMPLREYVDSQVGQYLENIGFHLQDRLIDQLQKHIRLTASLGYYYGTVSICAKCADERTIKQIPGVEKMERFIKTQMPGCQDLARTIHEINAFVFNPKINSDMTAAKRLFRELTLLLFAQTDEAKTAYAEEYGGDANGIYGA
jgi:hypothetical protein